MSTIVMKAEYFTHVFSHRLLAACSIAASLLHSYAIVQNRNLEVSSSTLHKYNSSSYPYLSIYTGLLRMEYHSDHEI